MRPIECVGTFYSVFVPVNVGMIFYVDIHRIGGSWNDFGCTIGFQVLFIEPDFIIVGPGKMCWEWVTAILLIVNC